MVITVFGLGFVGLTASLGFCELGHTVYGLEVNRQRYDTIASGKIPFLEPGLEEALGRHLNSRFFLTEDPEKAAAESDCIYYCVGTPYGKDGHADLTYLFEAITKTLPALRDNKFRVLVVKSTIPPSTTSSEIVPFIEAAGFRVGEDIGVANNPEFLREGHCWDDFLNADRIVFGTSDERSEQVLREIYRTMDAPVHCVSLNTGEYIKYLSNTLLATLISYSNEMSLIADTIGGIDVARAFRILHEDRRWGGCNMSSYVYPGCGYGGYCLPKDTNALYATVKSAGFDPQILKNVIETNDNMPQMIAQRIIRAAGSDPNTVISVLGLSFKPGSDDTRSTPSAKVIKALNDAGYRNIVCYDPAAMKEFQANYSLDYQCCDSLKDCIDRGAVIAITTAWPEFAGIRQYTEKPIVDCRYMLTDK